MYYYSAPKPKQLLQSLDEVDEELLRTFDKLGIPLEEQKRLAGVAVDAIFDSVSIATTFQETLSKYGVIFCPMSEAVREHPDLVQKYLGSVVPYADNFYAALNSAVYSEGSFCYVPKGVRCPLELSTYFRINNAEQVSSSGPLSSPTKAATSATWKGAALRCAIPTSCTLRSWNSSRWTTLKSSTPPSRTGTPATKTARAASTTS